MAFFVISTIAKRFSTVENKEEPKARKHYDPTNHRGDYFEEAKKLFREMQETNNPSDKSPYYPSEQPKKKKKKQRVSNPVEFFSYDDLQNLVADPKNIDRNFYAIDENYAQGEECSAHLQAFLHDEDNLKTGILVSEILGKPLSMRDERRF